MKLPILTKFAIRLVSIDEITLRQYDRNEYLRSNVPMSNRQEIGMQSVITKRRNYFHEKITDGFRLKRLMDITPMSIQRITNDYNNYFPVAIKM